MRLISGKSLLILFFSLGLWFCAQQQDPSPASIEAGDLPEPVPEEPNPALLIPTLAHDKAPPEFRIRLDTTKGSFVVEVKREWAPNGVDRLYNLARIGFFENVAFFRVIEGFVAQFGVHGDPEINQPWSFATIQDDPPKLSNKKGSVTFAAAGPNSRTTQLFVNLRDNIDLDSNGFAPVGRVLEGIAVVESLYAGYGEPAPKGKGPRPKAFHRLGNKYLKRQFPELDYITAVTILE